MEIKNKIKSILTNHTINSDDIFFKEKVITLNIVMLIMGTIVFSFGVLRYTQENYIQAIADFVMTAIIILSYIALYRNHNYLRPISRMLIFFAVLTSLFLIILNPEIDTRFSWLGICIYLMFFLLDLKEGIRWIAGMITVMAILFITNIIELQLSEFVIFFVTMTLFTFLLSRYEKIKQKSEQQFLHHNKELKEAVDKKTVELRLQKEMFETLFQKSYDGILLIEDNFFIECNDSVLKMLGYENKDDLLNTHPSELSPKYQVDGELSYSKADKMMQMCISNGAHNFEWLHQKANKDNFWCDITLTNLTIGDKNIIHAVIRDISDKKALEFENIKIKENLEEEVQKRTQELVVAMKAKADFLANMSHEIRTPLNAILGFIEILKKDETDPKRQKYFNIINSSGQDLLTIINDILDFSKIQSGKVEIEYIPINLSKSFKDTQLLFFEKAKEKDINLELNISSKFPEYVLGDSVKIKQVLSNLISNAIKFTPKNKNIYIDADYKDGFLNVFVKDEGIGIDKKNQGKIFDSFSQEDSSTTRKYGGTGLGLSISAQLVKLLGGELKLKSEIGVGSKFYFSIPLEITDEIKEQKTQQNIGKLEGHVLIVEDNKVNQLFLEVILDKIGLTIDIANDGKEAVELFKTTKYDLVLMDENMPIMNGIEATKKIIEIEKQNKLIHTPIIAVTANGVKGDKQRFMEIGMDEYIVKPIDIKKLNEVLGKFL